MRLWKFIREKMLEHPYQTVCEGNASLTYEELCVFAELHAQKLNSSYYGILCNSEMATAMAILACMAAGKVAIPMPARYGREAYSKIIERAQMPTIITDFGNKLSEMDIYPQPKTRMFPESTAVVLFTSGSTGEPKGVMLSESNLISNIEDISSYFSVDENDTVLISRPLYHSSVMTGEFLLSLCKGAKIVFSSEPFQPINILSLMKKHEVTVFGSTPTLLATLSKFVRKESNTYIKKLSVSGECMTEGMATTIRKAFPNALIYCGYGLSEASPRVAYLPPAVFDKDPTSAGIPLPSVELRIVNQNGEEQPSNKIGELLVKGPNVMQCYFGDIERTKDVLKNGWLYTGDLALRDDNGMLYIKGRKDDMIIRAGMNIYPAEIENALSTDKRVESVLCYGYKVNGTQEIALIVSGDFANVGEVRDLCREKLPPYQMPQKLRLADKTETLNGGKKKRKNI